MQQNYKDYEYCIKVAIDNALKRIDLLNDSDKKSVLEEYKEWIKVYMKLRSKKSKTK